MTPEEFSTYVELLGGPTRTARQLGLTRRTISRLLSGNYAISVHNERALAAAMNRQAASLMGAARTILTQSSDANG